MSETPSLRRRRLVGALKRLREEQGKTLADAAEAAGFSEAKVSRIESFKSAISGDDTFTLATALGADETTANALVSLARSAKHTGWWHDSYEDNGLGAFADFLELEEEAREVFEFHEVLIPGRFQTPRYAATVIRADLPNATEEEIERRVQLRIDRQARDSAPFWAVVFEDALTIPVGGHEVMAEQLDHLAKVATKPGTRLQILPASSKGHPAMGTSFTLFTLNDGTQFAHIDTLTGGLFIEEGVAVYDQARAGLQAAANPFDTSVNLVLRGRDNHRSAV